MKFEGGVNLVGSSIRGLSLRETNSNEKNQIALREGTPGFVNDSGEVSIIPGATLFAFSSHVFTSAGRSGPLPPSAQALRTAYSSDWSDDPTLFEVTSGIQTWTVPATGSYKLEVAGARGGKPNSSSGVVPDSYRGKGAIMEGTFDLVKGQQLRIVVGQEGLENIEGNRANGGGPGGGGSFVWLQGASNPLIVAGGGGGSAIINTSYSTANLIGVGGTTSVDGTTSRATSLFNRGRNGGNALYADGALGWTSMRQSLSFTGRFTNSGYKQQAGFGGGGLGVDSHGAGGGGGYSGGGGGDYDSNFGGNPDGRNGGGGGGSYNSGSNQHNVANSNSGNGWVSVTRLD